MGNVGSTIRELFMAKYMTCLVMLTVLPSEPGVIKHGCKNPSVLINVRIIQLTISWQRGMRKQ